MLLSKSFLHGTGTTYLLMAKLFLKKYNNVFKCGSIKKNQWYELRDNRWVRIDGPHILGKLMLGEFLSDYERYKECMYKYSLDSDGYKKERLIEDIGMIMKAEKKLHSKICRNKIIRSVQN